MKRDFFLFCFFLMGMCPLLNGQAQATDTAYLDSTAWMGIQHALNNRFDSALTHLSKAVHQGDEVRNWALREKVYRQLIDIYLERQQTDSALKYARQLLDLQDSILLTEPDEQLNHQLLKFSLSKKEDEIRILQREEELEKVKLRHQRLLSASIGIGLLLVLGFLWNTFRQKSRIAKEKKRSDELLLNILPAEVAEELKSNGQSEARDFDEATVLFTDFKGFTQAAENMLPSELVAEIHTCFKAFDRICEEEGIEKIKTIGDAYMAVGGIPTSHDQAHRKTVLAALKMAAFIHQRYMERKEKNVPAFEMRVGIHTGPVVAGIVGIKKFQYDIWGDTVNTASRMESAGEAGKVNVSEATYLRLKNEPDLEFTHRGRIAVKGKGELDMYFVKFRSDS